MTASSNSFVDHNQFAPRHIGSSPAEVNQMLQAIGADSLDQLIHEALPSSIRLPSPMSLPGLATDEQTGTSGCTEAQALAELKAIAEQNIIQTSMIGQGYHNTITPPVILRNILENPLWYTPYTPYQPEISQGRLEALLNFQTMVCDLTGLPLANASMLDEATCAAEAMAMCFGIHRQKKQRFFASSDCHPQTLAVVTTRAKTMGIALEIGDLNDCVYDDTLCGVLVQYPATDGQVHNYDDICDKAHNCGSRPNNGALVVAACDILSLCILKPPGEWGSEESGGGADIAVGSTQRFGVPMGFGGPHAAYMATREQYVRKMPGRLIGVTRDTHGNEALRLSVQTREQHIKREKATSNICTAQVLLAVIAGMYAVWHGPEGLKQIATRIHTLALTLQKQLEQAGFKTAGASIFDTVCVTVDNAQAAQSIIHKACDLGINLHQANDTQICISLDETTSVQDLITVLSAFDIQVDETQLRHTQAAPPTTTNTTTHATRTTSYLTHSVFNQYHTEHELLRYITRLQNRDISLCNSMIALGSCTMKLNAAAEMLPVTWPEFANMHPYAPSHQTTGYQKLFADLKDWLGAITGLPGVSLQPNAGSQGEYAGLLAIRRFHEANAQQASGNAATAKDASDTADNSNTCTNVRDICLIPTSAHGTNPASAIIAGMRVVPVGCLDNGDIDLEDLKTKAQTHADQLAALMITYPSTHGVFEDTVQTACQIIHDHGGKVYLDGANMNAQVGLTNPAICGGDVCHLNLHKTFCIPHGGGGPGMGPICCTKELEPYLPGNPTAAPTTTTQGAVSAADNGSAMILPISWMYIRMMGAEGLTQATRYAILNANYMATCLQDSYDILFTGPKGRCAHEFILDCRPFVKTAHITVEDIAKRLIDFGFHAPTMSWPVAGTLMVEPTESESKAELDRFCIALQTIYQEIKQVEQGQLDPENNPLKNAPHTAANVSSDEWAHPYPRKQGAYPANWLTEPGAKYWPPVGRVDNAYGDKNLVCTCPSVEELACSTES